ncbi:hypothetical protein [Planobispora longispora]|uniref:Uncharacterized protein n=1 Tax=Planobispora longispora TaxID=28887 RepID=A0A8J3RX37_9ACTN|nr:hypothetical protein [Planobispora longispora]GIH81582.1 hypothetical protein Plo01_80110 [Planobispora longispora]
MASPTRRLLGIWLPTALGASMLVLEIPVVYAGAARSSAGPQILAAMGICVAILVVVNSPALAITPLVVAAHDRHHARRLWRHSLLTGLAGALTLVALATVPPLIALVRLAFDADEVLLDHVRAGLVGLAPNALGVALRRYLHGRLIIAGRTRAIATATGARLAGTFALAWGGIALLPQHGALVAGLALSAGAFSESAGLALAVRRLPRPPARGQGRYGELLRRHAEISTTRLLNMVPMVITTVGVAHSAQAAASLMVWPAIYELTMLFASPTSDWEAVVATALRQDRRDGTPRRLTIWLAGAFASAFVIVLATGPAALYLRDLLVVPQHPAGLALDWAALLVPVPALWLVRGYLRGVILAGAVAGWLVGASLAHTAALIVSLMVLARTPLPGVAVASLAVLAGMTADLAATGYGAARSRRFSLAGSPGC